jgi:aspartyl-tRNA(Asn)/glutamyl-tRNA(Gln) amidotransferase subunit A
MRAGTLTSLDLVEASLEAAGRHARETNAFIRLDAEAVRTAARAADAERRRGVDHGVLHGVPISLKDLIDVEGEVTTAASRVLADRVAPRDATLVTRLRQAGAVLFGRTNLHEFALGTTSEDSAFGPVRNPRDLSRSPGGSSGGAAAAVAAGMGLGAIGTDTGGSIRIPAAACGVVGLKPSYGEVPTDGVIPLSLSLDHAGPLTRTVADAHALWTVLAEAKATQLERVSAGGLRFASPGGYFDLLDHDVRAAFDRAIEMLRRAGIHVDAASIAGAETIVPAYVAICLPEGAHWHAPYLDTRAQEYSPIVHKRFVAGRSIPAVDYLAALDRRTALRAIVDEALASVDAIVLPTLPIVAPALGVEDVTVDAARGSASLPVRSAMLRQTQLFNLTGHPAISIPIPVTGLPVGLQLVGRHHETARLLSVAAAVEHLLNS